MTAVNAVEINNESAANLIQSVKVHNFQSAQLPGVLVVSVIVSWSYGHSRSRLSRFFIGALAPATEWFGTSRQEAMMSDRENSPAFAMLPRCARRVFAAIEQAIGDGSSVSVGYTDFKLDHHIARTSISSSLKLLDHLGLIEIEPGTRLVNIFRFSNRWRTVDEVGAVMLAARAREVKPHRTFEKRREPKAVKRSTPKPMTVERPRVMQRRLPSLPTMPWQDDGR